MSPSSFFEESREQSVVKSTIVEKYFDAWARIITATQKLRGVGDRIGYIDLFAGPGRYEDGTESTPLRVLRKAIENQDLRTRLVTLFNDKTTESVASLQAEVAGLPGITNLKHRPILWNEEVGDKIAAHFEGMNKIPCLIFVDPWGYKGLSLRLVQAFLSDWGCDCIFFFNYARINAGLNNDIVREHMNALFGEDRADQLRSELVGLNPAQRETAIVEALAQSLKSFGHKYVLPFCFKNDAGTRTKHHLVLVTKHFKGYEVMKEVMSKESSSTEQGVASFAYCPTDSSDQGLLFSLSRPLDDLRAQLLSRFAGLTLTTTQIYQGHSVDTPYTKKNYKAVLRILEDEGVIEVQGRRSSVGFADHHTVVFPERD